MPLVEVVISLLVLWTVVTVLVVALCVSARSIDKGLGMRRARSPDPVEREPAAPAEVELE